MHRQQLRFVGRVQGVGFRATTRDIAQRWPVTGWVRNEPDGSVLLEVQGDEASVRAMLAQLRQRMAKNIQHEHATPLPLREGEDSFEVRR